MIWIKPDFAWTQVFGAISGGLVGGFFGFIANTLHRHFQFVATRKNVSSALIGEIEALKQRLEEKYLLTLRVELQMLREQRQYPIHHFRGEKDYAPVFHSLGHNIGYLRSPLPRDLVDWYTRLAICQEGANELHELTIGRNPDLLDYAAEVTEKQLDGFTELVALAEPLIAQLSRY